MDWPVARRRESSADALSVHHLAHGGALGLRAAPVLDAVVGGLHRHARSRFWRAGRRALAERSARAARRGGDTGGHEHHVCTDAQVLRPDAAVGSGIATHRRALSSYDGDVCVPPLAGTRRDMEGAILRCGPARNHMITQMSRVRELQNASGREGAAWPGTYVELEPSRFAAAEWDARTPQPCFAAVGARPPVAADGRHDPGKRYAAKAESRCWSHVRRCVRAEDGRRTVCRSDWPWWRRRHQSASLSRA